MLKASHTNLLSCVCLTSYSHGLQRTMNDNGLSGPAGVPNKVILSLAQFVESTARKTFESRRVRRCGGFCKGVSDLQGFPPRLSKKNVKVQFAILSGVGMRSEGRSNLCR